MIPTVARGGLKRKNNPDPLLWNPKFPEPTTYLPEYQTTTVLKFKVKNSTRNMPLREESMYALRYYYSKENGKGTWNVQETQIKHEPDKEVRAKESCNISCASEIIKRCWAQSQDSGCGQTTRVDTQNENRPQGSFGMITRSGLTQTRPSDKHLGFGPLYLVLKYFQQNTHRARKELPCHHFFPKERGFKR